MDKLTNCPYCNAPLKSGWNSNDLSEQKSTDFVNFILQKTSKAYCEKCMRGLLDQAKEMYLKEKSQIITFINDNIEKIPILSTHTPFGWQYEAISIVTSQSVTGTGFMSEFKSSFTDFLGTQSGSFNKKISDGEKLCFSQLRSKAMLMGANAIIATDIDYGDVGEGKGMLLVCAAGTAVKVTNVEVLGDAAQIVDEMRFKNIRLTEIELAYKAFTPYTIIS